MLEARSRIRGVKALIQDAVEHGSRAIESIQKESAEGPFSLLEAVPPIAPVVRAVHAIHDASVSSVHISIRAVNRALGVIADGVIDVLEKKDDPAQD